MPGSSRESPLSHSTNVAFLLTKLNLSSGKFYKGSKDNEISADEVDKLVVPPQGQGIICTCGRSDAAIGTEGYVTVYEWDGEHETKICRVYWSAPWGAYSNIFDIQEWDPSTSDYSISHDPVSQDGTIGNMELVIAKLA